MPAAHVSPPEQTARMPGRVEVDLDVILRLVVGQHRSGRHCMRTGGAEVGHGDVEVHRHLLVARPGRPDRAHVLRLGLKRQAGSALR